MKTLLFLWLFMVCARAQPEDGEGTERPRVLCGRILADARMLYCFSNTDPQKRSSPSGMIASIFQRQGTPQGTATPEPRPVWRWLADSHALALRSKRDPGLVDECCLKACYVSELLNYC